MCENRKKNHKNKMTKCIFQRDILINMKRKIQENINIEEESLEMIDRNINNYDFFLAMYQDIPKDKIENFSDQEYDDIYNPIEKLTHSGEGYSILQNQLKDNFEENMDFKSGLCSLCVVGQSHSSALFVFEDEKDVFPNYQNIKDKFRVIDDLYNQIEYIKKQLKDNFPNVFSDFEQFIKKYTAFPNNSSKYQDLIGSRSMFFLKLMKNFSNNTYGVYEPWQEVITKFTFGSSAPPDHTENIISDCKNLWNDLSNQTTSVKVGNVSVSHIQSMFRRIITNFYSIFQLREQYFVM